MSAVGMRSYKPITECITIRLHFVLKNGLFNTALETWSFKTVDIAVVINSFNWVFNIFQSKQPIFQLSDFTAVTFL